MQIPLEISFHNLPKSDWAEDEIRKRVQVLEQLYDRLVGCRVTVDQRADARRTPPVVRIEMSVPGHRELVVTPEPSRLQSKFQKPDLHNAIHDAFAAAERQLRDFKRQREGHSNAAEHERESQLRGQVASVSPAEDHGFLLTNDGSLLYFHRNSVIGAEFDQLKTGDAVHYVPEIGDTGPLAKKVRPAAS